MVHRIIAVFGATLLFMLRANASKDILRLGVLIPEKGELNLSAYIHTMELALETVNNDATLPFQFKTIHSDSMCQALPATRGFIDQVFSSSNESHGQILLIGAGCSVATEPVAELAPYWNLVQISPVSTSPRLSNNNTFPTFLRTVSSEAEIIVGIVQAMKQFGWSRIAIITQSENIFTFIATRLKQELSASNLQLIRELTFNTEDNVTAVMKSLRNSPARIVFLNMYSAHAAEVLCQAYKNEMFHPTYAWMFINWYLDGWWMNENVSCIKDHSVKAKSLQRVLRNSLILDHLPRIEDMHANDTTVGNISWNQYVSRFEHRFGKRQDNDINDEVVRNDSAYMFDAIWTAALALKRTAMQLKERKLTLMDFDYNDKHNISDIIYEEALKTNFFGLTGNVSFLPNGDRPGKVRLLQYRDSSSKSESLEKIQFARINDGVLKYDIGESDSTVYTDETPQDEEHNYISLPLFIVYTTIAIIGITFALVCLVLNLWLRNHKLVKLSSPYVNIMIVAGAVVFYVTVILFGVDENVASYSTVDGLCHARIWLVSIGFSLLYGTIFAKTWRIYYIFSHTKPNSKFEIKDMYLFGIVGILVVMDIVFLIPVTVVLSSRLRTEYEEIEGDEDSDLPQIIGVCTSEGSLTWFPVLFAYKGFILLAGLFLAFETRKVKIKSLNDSRFIAMSVYGAVVVSIAITPIGLLLNHFPNVQYGIIGIMILSSTSLILGLIFVTKLYKVYQDPEGTSSLEQIDANYSKTNDAIVNGTTDGSYYKSRIVTLNEEIIALNKKNKALNNELAKFNDTEARDKEMDMTATIKNDMINDTTM